MNKCKNCVWADKINKELVFCILPNCVKKIEGEKKDVKASRDL